MDTTKQRKLTPNLSPVGAWAFALGTSIGWGSLVVTANTYLAQAGPWGSVLGMVFATVIMLLIARNYSYLMQIFPEAGGAYAYSREVFNHDQGFLTGWFLALTYMAVLWANATSIPLYARNFLGGIFSFGKMYTIFEYDVYAGEVIVTIIAILLSGFLCARFRDAAMWAMTILVCLFTVGIAVVFLAALFLHKGTYSPGYIPDSAALSQIIRIAVISPWAFIGFENISHASEELAFEKTRIFRVFVAAVILTALLYIFITVLSVTAYPDRYDSWLAYIRDLGNLHGLEAFPAFYAASCYLGRAGVGLLMLSLLALVVTSLIGNTTALSRLLYAMGKDEILPARFGTIGPHGAPATAVMAIAVISSFVPLVGRTAIGWIVDVTTIGATLIYAFVSAAALKIAQEREDRIETVTGGIGLAAMIGFGLLNLLPNLVSTSNMERETFFLFIVWSILGFLFFRTILRRDRKQRFGRSIVVWVALLSLVLLIALIWMRQSLVESNDLLLRNINDYYAAAPEGGRETRDVQYIVDQVALLRISNARTMLLGAGLFAFAILIMLTNHFYMNMRSAEHERAANVDPMTGVKSKHAYILRENQINNEIEEKKLEEFAVVVCDVNGLKKINDTLGHKAGDEYIIAACRMICEIFAHSPVYRIGGDEFVAILTGRDYILRRDLLKLLHDRSAANIKSGGVVVSGAYADFVRGEDRQFHDVFGRADALMYEEKQLLKGMGAVTRDEEPVEPAEKPEIFSVKKQILIVEDEPINQMLLGNALQEEYRILFASDGVEAMEEAFSHRDDLDLVLLDLQMPRMNGMEVLRTMKADDELKGIPVIVLTADQQAEVECLNLGAMDFIPKPYPAWEIIRARVSKCVELLENRDTIQSTERESLTKLYTFEYFVRYVNMYDRHYREVPMDAVFVDINHFQMINELYGRSYGDQVLRRIGEKIRAFARETGSVGCRRGADTFYIYCPHKKDYTPLLEDLSTGFGREDGSDPASNDRVRIRMGIYPAADRSLEIEQRFDRAKMAADNVKNSPVQAIGVYDEEMHREALYRERLLEEFSHSLEEDRFRVWFQPKYDVRPDRPVLASAEALVRWDHPELGMISPAVFIPLLEESGRILELDACVWRKTAAQIREWKDRIGSAVPVSVNVSRIDMLTPGLRDMITEILDTYGLTPDDILLEITESAYTENSGQVISTAHELRAAGFHIEMDDFGTGYSSLGMLTHLPVDAIKLDQSFILSAFGEKRDARMIELILDIADYLHVPVVAEGVETREQMLALKDMGCEMVQGYYFSKPVPAEEFEPFFGS